MYFVGRIGLRRDEFRICDRVVVEKAPSMLASTNGCLPSRVLSDGNQWGVLAGGLGTCDEFVNEIRGRGARSRDDASADAEGIDRCIADSCDPVLVEISARNDPGSRGAELVEYLARPVRLRGQVSGVETNRAKFRACDIHSSLDRGLDIERID